jgi:hypothetical protein
MCGPNPSGDISYLQTWCDPTEIGVRREESIEFVDALLSAAAVRRHEQLRHRDGGRNRCMFRPFQPREDGIGESDIARVGFELINEDAGVKSDPVMPPQKRAQGRQSQLFRSLARWPAE